MNPKNYEQVAELVEAKDCHSFRRKPLWVRVPSGVPKIK